MMNAAGTSREQMHSGDHVSLDIDNLADSVEKELKILRSFSDQCSIYRVPKVLRKSKEKAYTPQLISIGPLHHGKKELKEMEEHKRLYLGEFLELSSVSVKCFLEYIAEKETRLRNCYAETFDNLRKKEFVEMMLLDCSFLIMFLLKRHFPRIRSSNIDRIFNKPWMIDEIVVDLCLLENQLPFFIVEDLCKLSKILHYSQESSMIMLTRDLLSNVWDSWVLKDIWGQIKLSKVEHFIDLLRIFQQPAQKVQPKKLVNLTTPSAAQLHQAGIKFKKGSSINLLDIKFDYDKGTLEIPPFRIEDRTEILLRNLQAFERCHWRGNNYVSNYIDILSWLVPSTKDVRILGKNEILENWLPNNDAVSSLFRNLSKGNVVDSNNYYFSGLVEDLNNYCKKRRPKWKAALKQKYFQNPWTIISVVAAAVLLILTIIQTVCSIIQVA